MGLACLAACNMPILGIIMPKMSNIASDKDSWPARRKAAADVSVAPTSLADALFTTTQQRMLALIFGQPGRSFYASELIKRTGSGSGAVQRELKRLASSGLVRVKHIGNQKHYQANPDSPVFEELSSLVRKTVALAEPIREALASLNNRIDLAVLYGCVAKGTDTASSDIDILIVGDGFTLEDIYTALSSVEADLERKISPSLYTRKEFSDRKAANNPFLSRVLSGEHLVLIDKVHESSTA
jgi:predicted nucleotidyltransferase/predicted transcriptional regulator